MHHALVLAALLGPPGDAPLFVDPTKGVVQPEPVTAKAVGDMDLRWFWKNGLRFETDDGSYRFRLGGRIHFDAGWFTGSDLETAGFSLDDGSELRRARLYMSGDLPDGLFFKAEYDFAGSVGNTDNRPSLTDVFVGKKGLFCDVDLKVGHFKEPFGLEQLTGANYLTFIERGSPDALVPKRNDGVQLSGTFGEGGTWALGGFRANTDNAGFSTGDGGYAGTTRVTWAPVCDTKGGRVLHLGGAYTIRDVEGPRFRSRPEAHLLGDFVDTGAIAGNDDVGAVGLELASVLGPVAMQAEYIRASTTGGMDVDVDGWYAETSCFLTGEQRPYKASTGTFARVVPARPTSDGGCGAWQLALRVSRLNLTDGAVTGGDLTGVSFGVNWHLTANMRLMLNHVLSNVDDPSVPVDDNASITVLRFQVDW